MKLLCDFFSAACKQRSFMIISLDMSYVFSISDYNCGSKGSYSLDGSMEVVCESLVSSLSFDFPERFCTLR